MIAAFWQRTEYRSVQLAPWQQMSRDYTTASKSLLLDYVSSFQPRTLSTSIKHGHYAVAAAVTGSVVIRLMIILSTGLLALQQQLIEAQDSPLIATTAFVGTPEDLNITDALPVYVTRGLQALQLPCPAGTTPRHAVQSFRSLDSNATSSRLTAVVNGFTAELECEIANMDVQYWYLGNLTGPDFVTQILFSSFSVSSPTCRIDNLQFPETLYVDDIEYVSIFTSAKCVNATSQQDANRLFIALGSAVTHVASNPNLPENQNITMLHSTQIVCKPYYTFGKVSVTVNNTEALVQNIMDVSAVQDAVPAPIPGISGWDIAEAFLMSFSSASQYGYWTTEGINPWASLPFWYTTLQYPNNHSEDFLDSSLLIEATQSLYSLVCAQIVRQQLLGSSNSDITGTITTDQKRLVVRTLSLRLLEALSGLMVVLGLYIILAVPTKILLPQDPGSLAGMFIILSKSKDAVQSLRHTGSLSLSAIEARTSGIEYRLTTSTQQENAQVSIEANIPPHYKIDAFMMSKSAKKWWHPFMASTSALLLCVLAQVGIIVALEATFRYSQNHNGLADVVSAEYLPYVWSLLPAFVLSCIAAAYTGMSFLTKIFAPYCALKSTATAQNSFLINYLDKTALRVIWNATRRGQTAVSLITFAALLGTLLTIAVSGVFFVQASPYEHSVNVNMNGWFITSDQLGHFGTGTPALDALVASALVVEGNLSYPAWTYGEFVFPHIAIDQNSLTNASKAYVGRSTSLSLKVPALRSKQHCGYFRADKELNATFPQYTNVTTSGNVTVTVYSQIDWNGADVPYCSNGVEPPVSYAQVGNGTFGQAQNQWADCQPMYTWGSTGYHTIEHIASLACNDTMEQVEVNVVFTLPDFSIDTRTPPVADESTAKFFSYPDVLENGELWGGLPTITAPPNLDSFFAALVEGKDEFPVAQLADPAHDDEVVSRIRHLNALLRAQEYNVQGRAAVPDSFAQRNLTGFVTDPSRTRLVQNEVSTRIVQCLLGVMAACAIVSSYMMNTKEVLPHNPCSIAGVASLLVDAEMVKDEAIVTSLASSEGKLRKNQDNRFDRRMFRLGWHESTGSDKRDPVSGVSTDGTTQTIRRKPLPSKRRFGIDVVETDPTIEEATGLDDY